MTEYICTNCNRKLYATDKVCDYCGCPIIFEPEEYAKEIEYTNRFKKRRKGYLAIYALILFSSVAIYLKSTVFTGDISNDSNSGKVDEIVETKETNGIDIEEETVPDINDLAGTVLTIGDAFEYNGIQYKIQCFKEFDNSNGKVVDPGDGYKWYELCIAVSNISNEDKYVDINGTYFEDGVMNSLFPSTKYKSEDTLNAGCEEILAVRVCKSEMSKDGMYIWALDENLDDIKIKLF